MALAADPKYRGSKAYLLVYSELIGAARSGGTIAYGRVAEIMGLPTTANFMAAEVGHLLGEMSEDEHRNGRPMLSAIAVGASGMPGQGFFKLARDLAKLGDCSPDNERAFWEREKKAVYATWQQAATAGKVLGRIRTQRSAIQAQKGMLPESYLLIRQDRGR
jgi:hypothetical protein